MTRILCRFVCFEMDQLRLCFAAQFPVHELESRRILCVIFCANVWWQNQKVVFSRPNSARARMAPHFVARV